MDAALDLSVVIVTWNCRDLALRCLGTITEVVRGLAHEIFVVDNASSDGTPDAIALAYPAVCLIRNDQNSGFAAANNLALTQARGRHWLLLNPDAFPQGPEAVHGLIAFLDANPTVAAAAPRLRHADGRHQVGDAGYAPSIGTVAIHAFALTRLSMSLRGVFLTRIAGTGPRDVDWLCAACMMVRADAGRRVGLLDETFFMYGEDIEWGCRMRDHGWRVVYIPGLEAVHLGGATQPAAISTTWLDGLSEIYRRRNGDRGMGSFRTLLVFGYAGRALVYGAASLLPGQADLRSRAHSMVAYARYGLRVGRRDAPARLRET